MCTGGCRSSSPRRSRPSCSRAAISCTTPELIVGGLVIGLVIVGAWYVSAHIGHVAEDPATLEEKFLATNSGRAESFSFVAPTAYSPRALAPVDGQLARGHGIAGVLGMIAGSFVVAIATRSFRWEGFANAEIGNHLAGGARMMGFGGVTALGCTIGQGLTGVSTLAVGSFLTLFSIIGGCILAALPDAAHRPPGDGVNTGLTSRAIDTMIVFDLACPHGHAFEGWFASADARADQRRLPVYARYATTQRSTAPARRGSIRGSRAIAVAATTAPSAPAAGLECRDRRHRRGIPPELLAKLREIVKLN